MRASLKGRDELAVRVQIALSLPTKKEAEHVVNAVITSLETTLINHLGTDGFTLKLKSFGKFSVRYGRTPNLWVGKSARRSGFPKLFPATTELTAPQCDDGIRAPAGPMHAGQLYALADDDL